VQIGDIACCGLARIDHDNLCSALFLCRDEPLVQDRMTPCHVAADQHDEIGLFDILVAAGHDVFTKRAHVAGDRGSHA
jgi:hypothetical protein